MLSRISFLLLALCFANTAVADFDCDFVAGQWKGERFEESLDAERTSLITFFPNGRYRFEFHTFNDFIDEHAVDTGTWYCRGNRITFSATGIDGRPIGLLHTYEILELDSTYFVFKAIEADCSLFVGDCEDVVYGLTRIPGLPNE